MRLGGVGGGELSSAITVGEAGPSNYQPPTKKSRRDRFHDNFDYMLDTVDELGDKDLWVRLANLEPQRKKNIRFFAWTAKTSVT